MPVRSPSNNKVLPQNQRSVDVARRQLADILPIQQRKYDNAFQVVGYECLVYNRLKAGLVCSCQGGQRALATLLNEDGKMPAGKMNELLTRGMEFEVNRYGTRTPVRDDIRELRDPPVPAQTKPNQFFDGNDNAKRVPGFEIVGSSLDDPFADRIIREGEALGTNGPVSTTQLDDLVGDFDGSDFHLGDSTCGVCFGTGFVGGFSLVGGWRAVLSTQWPDDKMITNGTIEVNAKPFYFEASDTRFTVVLPKGFISLDSFRVYNNEKAIDSGRIFIDDVPLTYNLLYEKFDGEEHEVTVQYDEPTKFTHLELQVNLSTIPMKIEFPRLQQSADITKLDTTADVALNGSPIIPIIEAQDIIMEMTFGKGFIVTDVSWWNDNFRNVLGWDMSARVLSPNEVVNLLPRRGGRHTDQQATNFVRDNFSGIHRT